MCELVSVFTSLATSKQPYFISHALKKAVSTLEVDRYSLFEHILGMYLNTQNLSNLLLQALLSQTL